MKLKANLHFHSKEDPLDSIPYTLKEGIDEAARLKFDVLAITLHNTFGYSSEVAQYAAARGILLISGIEKTIHGCHVVVLNCDDTVESVSSFEELATYKYTHPECFVLAPHPYFFIFSLQEKLEEYPDLFDAIEWSWYYSRMVHRANDRARDIAASHAKPFVATSDTHRLRYLDRSYALIEAASKDADAIMQALRSGSFENISRPSSFFREMLIRQVCISLGDEWKRMVSTLAKWARI